MGGHRERPLPVWRLRFDDANATEVTIDPRTGAILQLSDTHRRADRWLFAFLHSFDLPVLLASRPAWDLGMLGFSLAGLGLSLTAVVTGWRRLRRKAGWPAPARRESAIHPPASAEGATIRGSSSCTSREQACGRAAGRPTWQPVRRPTDRGPRPTSDGAATPAQACAGGRQPGEPPPPDPVVPIPLTCSQGDSR
ncbi:MAG: hypothetical protein JNM26_17020 [Ideonella sp.]|nr:hypothetical protein [Ideonella sp.]